jgi:hypothetical protein
MERNYFYLWRAGGRLVVAVSVLFWSNSGGLALDSRSPFTQAEVIAGHASFHDYCAGCHGDELQGGGLQGGGDAPQLTGPNFNQDWSKQTIRVLYRFVSQTMPDGLAGDLSAKMYSDILSFLLAANGAKPGSAPFNPNSDIRIGDIANGQIVTAVTNAPIGVQAGGVH